jgi:hypothetical protein
VNFDKAEALSGVHFSLAKEEIFSVLSFLYFLFMVIIVVKRREAEAVALQTLT